MNKFQIAILLLGNQIKLVEEQMSADLIDEDENQYDSSDYEVVLSYETAQTIMDALASVENQFEEMIGNMSFNEIEEIKRKFS